MDYYSILGVSKTATDVEIKHAYRRLAKTYHPDRNKSPDAEDMIKKVNEAYDVLSDKRKRSEYDAKKHGTNMFGGFGRSNFDIGDIFSNSFDLNKKNTRAKNSKKFESQSKLTIQIDFVDSVLGIDDKKIVNPYKRECNTCHGYGGEFTNCPHCNGNGVINRNDGFISINITCNNCLGTGKKITKACPSCGGDGYVMDEEEMSINIPEGLEARTKLFVRGKGNYINGSRGDLYVTVEIHPDEKYERRGIDIIMFVAVDVLDVLMEKTITVESFRGEFSMDLDPVTISDDVVLPQRGTKSVNGNNYGNLIIKPVIKIPKLTEEQKIILDKLLLTPL